MRLFKYCILTTFLLIGLFSNLSAQDNLGPLGGGSFTNGGAWLNSGNLIQFSSAGQTAAGYNLVSTDQTYTGSVGFVGPVIRFGENNQPIAITPGFSIFVNENQNLILEGFDPDGDLINYSITVNPELGTLELVSGTDNEYRFIPNPDLQPETLYSDQLQFRVIETVTGIGSEVAIVPFRFELEDQLHSISSMEYTEIDAANGEVTITWTDAVFNASYTLEVGYYDLSNVNAPVFRTAFNRSVGIGEITTNGNELSFTFPVDETIDPYLFSATQVFATLSIKTPNGNSDFDSFVFEDGSAARTDVSEDGQFFAFGSRSTVTENKSVELKLIAVELGEFDISTASVEVLTTPQDGTVSTPIFEKQTDETKSWVLQYTGTKEIGSLDSVQFRIFNASRQLNDTAWAVVEVIDVNDQPELEMIPDQSTNEEEAITIPIVFSDPDNEVEVIVESSETTNVPATYADGVITITPGLDFSGNASVSVIIRELDTEQEYVDYDRFDVEIAPVNDPPSMSIIDNQTIEEDNSLTLVLSATDVDATVQSFAFNASADDPSSVSLEVDGSTLRVIPAENVFGTFEISVVADDKLGTENSKSIPESFTLEVTPVNDAPEILKQFPTQTIVTGFDSYSINMSAYFNDVENGADLDYLATGGSLIAIGFDSITANVSIDQNFNGVEDIVITASDGELEVSQTVTFVSLEQSPDVVIANPLSAVELQEDFGQSTVDASNVFADQNNANATFSYSLFGNNFVDAVIDENTGIITLTSTVNFFGEDQLFVVATTAGKSNFTSVDLIVNPVNDAPVLAEIDNQSFFEDETLSGIFISATDIDNENDELSISAVSSNQELVADANISFTTTSAGWLTSVQPVSNAFGTANILITVSDGNLSDTTSFIVDIQPVNDIPVASSTALPDATEDAQFSIDLSSLITDVDGDNITFSLASTQNWLSLSGSTLSGTPENSNVGPTQVIISANDGKSGILRQTFDLNVINVNDAPVLVNEIPALTVLQESNWTYAFPQSSFADVDAGDQLTYEFVDIPEWTSQSNLTLTGNPQYEDIGTYSMTLRVTDQAGESVSTQVDIEVVFTVYDAEVTVETECTDGVLTLTASGAVTYNWYNSEGELIEAETSSISVNDPGNDVSFFVEGQDNNGNLTPSRVEVVTSCEKALGVSGANIEISLFPNPVSTSLTIQHNVSKAEIGIYDVMGRKVDVRELSNNGAQIELDVSDLSNGIYFFKIGNDESSELRKFIKK